MAGFDSKKRSDYKNIPTVPPKVHTSKGLWATTKATGFGLLSGIKSMVVDNAKAIVSAVVPTIFSQVVGAAMNDPVVSKVVGGIGCAVGGGCLLLASGVVQIAKAAICRKKSAQKLTASRVAAATAGALLMGYGISNILSGYLNYQDEQRCREINSTERPFFDCNGTLPLYPQSREDQRATAALETRMRACPEVDEQWKRVECEGRFSLKHVSADVTPGGGAWQTCGRTMLISRDHQPEDFRLKCALFELSNAENDRHIRQLVLDTKAGTYGKQE
ncbi:MAG TPA: hypothetical protein VN457_07630, partial [Chlamydiales bacterium]|nr:hypothetical protein [Chlamydiales bacterium]